MPSWRPSVRASSSPSSSLPCCSSRSPWRRSYSSPSVTHPRPSKRTDRTIGARMFRRTIFTLSLAGAIVGLGATSAYALDCANVSRPAPAQTTPVLVVPGGPPIWVVQGDWWFVSFDGVFADGIWDKVPPGPGATVLGLTPDQAASLGFPAGVIK